VATDVQLTTVPVEAAANLLLKEPAGEALQPTGATLLSLTVDSNINPLLGPREILNTRSLCNPNDVAALQRVRLRQGDKIWQKSYRFGPNGVYHQRKKPVDEKQLELPPEQWTTMEKEFYQHNGKRLECPAVLEPSGLLCVVSAFDFARPNSVLSLCVFDRKQLHLVKVSVDGSRSLKVNYLEKSGTHQTRRTDTIDAIKISFQPRALALKNEEPEEFSFLGLKGDFDIFLDPDAGLPVQVSGKLATFGKMDIKLQAVEFAPGAR